MFSLESELYKGILPHRQVSVRLYTWDRSVKIMEVYLTVLHLTPDLHETTKVEPYRDGPRGPRFRNCVSTEWRSGFMSRCLNSPRDVGAKRSDNTIEVMIDVTMVESNCKGVVGLPRTRQSQRPP